MDKVGAAPPYHGAPVNSMSSRSGVVPSTQPRATPVLPRYSVTDESLSRAQPPLSMPEVASKYERHSYHPMMGRPDGGIQAPRQRPLPQVGGAPGYSRPASYARSVSASTVYGTPNTPSGSPGYAPSALGYTSAQPPGYSDGYPPEYHNEYQNPPVNGMTSGPQTGPPSGNFNSYSSGYHGSQSGVQNGGPNLQSGYVNGQAAPLVTPVVQTQFREPMGLPQSSVSSFETSRNVSPSPMATSDSPTSAQVTKAKSPPMPRRQYALTASGGFDAGVTPAVSAPAAAKALDIETFESVRRHAAAQPHNPEAQLELARKLCDAATSLAGRYSDPQNPSTIQVDARIESKNREAWILQAYKITKRLATKPGYPPAVFFLGVCYSSGNLGLERDDSKALECYLKAAKLNHPEACYRMAVCNEFGRGTRRDVEKALFWYKKAAQVGSVSSMYKLGMLALHGTMQGQPRNFQEGLIWLQRAAENADSRTPHAVHELALMYERSPASCWTPGDPLPKNNAKALELYYNAAKLGYGPSQSRLGHAYEFGELGCDVDPARSISWYMSAAQQGDADGNLGMCGWYWTGADRLLRQSDTEAFLWAERAASKDHMRGLFALGYFYEVGIGVTPNSRKAREYYMRAAEKRHPRAIDRVRGLDRLERDS